MLRNIYSIHKIGFFCYKHRIPIIPQILHLMEKCLFPASDISFKTYIGKNAYFPHRAIGVIINENAIIGDNVTIHVNVCIAGKPNGGVPIIGNNVIIGANSVILGG